MFVIGGAPRSGTSLLSSLVSQVPGVAVAHDSGLYYYFKFALMKAIATAQSTVEPSNALIINNMYINDLRTTNALSAFLNSSPREILRIDSQSDMRRKILDNFLYAMWYFWVNDGISPDPTKDRGRGESFLSQINGMELLNAETMRDLISNLVKKFALNMNNVDSREDHYLLGEKTPENTICGDVIQSIHHDCKYINLIRDPVSVYGAKLRRMRTNTEDFCNWYKQVADFKFIEKKNVLRVFYHDILSNPKVVIGEILDFIGANQKGDFSLENFEPPSHYQKYVGKQIDPSREIYLQSLVSEKEKAIILDECHEYLA